MTKQAYINFDPCKKRKCFNIVLKEVKKVVPARELRITCSENGEAKISFPVAYKKQLGELPFFMHINYET